LNACPRETTPATARATTVIGVLGGIASGKSLVAHLLAGDEGEVIDADQMAHEVLDSAEVLRRLRERFGERVIASDGRADRPTLSREVFADPASRAELESWIHPLVRERIAERLARARERGVRRVVLDVPLLLENDRQHGLASACDLLIFVDADLAERERRAMASRGWPPGELARREAAQMPLEAKRERADFVIENRAGRDELESSVRRLLATLFPS
jgi:dephospho-CoA kinase